MQTVTLADVLRTSIISFIPNTVFQMSMYYTLLITYISHFLTRYFTFLLLSEIPVMLTHIQYDSSFSIYFLALRDWHVLQMDWTIAW